MFFRAVLIAIGNELIRGERLETNCHFLCRDLFSCGFTVKKNLVIGDDPLSIKNEFSQAAMDADLIVISGGLGPTEDDITRENLAEALEVDLIKSPEALAQIKKMLSFRGRPFENRQIKQALVPLGTEIISNPVGVAPGFWGKKGNAVFLVLPGVPSELKAMWYGPVRDILKSKFEELKPPARKTLHLFGLSEVLVQKKIIDLVGTEAARKIGICANCWLISIYLVGELTKYESKMSAIFEKYLVATDDDTLEKSLVKRLKNLRIRIGIAESLTGGGIGFRLTSVPGASEVFAGGSVVYTVEAKKKLGVSPLVLNKYGTVSAQTACAMAESAKSKFNAQLGISATGYAGPAGGDNENPVGTVFVAAKTSAKELFRRIQVKGERNHVREVTINCALALALECIKHE